jgi:hypothetical protein
MAHFFRVWGELQAKASFPTTGSRFLWLYFWRS